MLKIKLFPMNAGEFLVLDKRKQALGIIDERGRGYQLAGENLYFKNLDAVNAYFIKKFDLK